MLRAVTPHPRKHELALGHDLQIFAVDLDFVAIWLAINDRVTSADAHIHFHTYHVRAAGMHPRHELRRFRPCAEDFGGRGVETPLEGEAGLGGHGASSSTKAAR